MSCSIALSRFQSSTAASALAAALVATATPSHATELAASAAPAQTSEQCGPLDRGVVTCDIAEGPFPGGVVYTSDGGMIINLADGLNIAPDAGNWGIAVMSNFGSVLINGSDANISARDTTALSAIAAGDVEVRIGDVETSGISAWGIAALSYEGDTTVSAGNISTDGDFGYGIIAESVGGNVTISADSISTSGFSADGITAFSGGDIDITAGSISGEGDYVWGINAFSGGWNGEEYLFGNTSIEAGSISISGTYARGASVVSYGSANLKIDELTINGDYGTGVSVTALDDVNIEIGDATFTGTYTGTIFAFSYGTSTVKVGTLTTENGGGILAYGFEGAHAEADKITVNGDYANAIQAVTTIGDASVKVGEVNASGFFAVAVNGDALMGDLVIEAGKITTQGDLAMGVRAFGRTSSITVTGPITTNGDSAFGILNSTTHGDAIIRATDISTNGNWAEAIYITGRYGTADIETTGKVSTNGYNSVAIRAEGEDGQVKLVANAVETSGDESNGIHARTRYVEVFLGQPPFPDPVEFTGNIDIKAETVKVTGSGSTGISARGLGAANIDVGTVSAVDSYAIETNMIEDSTISVRKSATSTLGSAILAEGEDVAVNIAAGATVAGGEDGIVIKAMGDRCVKPNPTDGSPNDCPNPGDDWGYPDPEPNHDVPPGVATITNAGTLSGGTGYAVRVENGTLTLNNSGTIHGAVLLGDGDDVINNSGTFNVSKDSDFGSGNDLFKNSGTLAIGSPSLLAAAAPETFQLTGLEKFENSGTIDLRSGVAGDQLILPGTYVGSGNAALVLDVDFTSNTADQLVVAGAATGTTQIGVNITAGNARLGGNTDLVLVQVGAGSSANAFVIADDARDIGFIRYGLAYDAAEGAYLLAAAAGAGAYRQLNALEGLESNWHSAASAVRTNITANRDDFRQGELTGTRNRLWGQVQAGKGSRDGTIRGSEPVKLDYDHDRTGVQLGFDLLGSEGDNSSFRAGITAGFADLTLDSKAAQEKTGVETVNFGVYASYVSDRLFGSVLAQYDKHDVKFDSVAAGFKAKADGSTWGIELEGGAHFAAGSSLFIEPLASIAWTHTSLDDLEALGQALDFDSRNGARGKIGVRILGNSKSEAGTAFRYYGSAKAVRDLGKRSSLTLVSGTETAKLKGDRLGTYGEAIIGGAIRTRGGFEAFVEGQADAGSDYKNLEGRFGLRFSF